MNENRAPRRSRNDNRGFATNIPTMKFTMPREKRREGLVAVGESGGVVVNQRLGRNDRTATTAQSHPLSLCTLRALVLLLFIFTAVCEPGSPDPTLFIGKAGVEKGGRRR